MTLTCPSPRPIRESYANEVAQGFTEAARVLLGGMKPALPPAL